MLHQKIMDQVSADLIKYEDMANASRLLTLTEKIKSFFAFLDLPEDVREYFMKRLKKFNKELLEESELCAG